MVGEQDKSRVGVLLVGHGTRNRSGLDEFFELQKRIAANLPGTAIQAAFLELAEPDLAAGVERLVAFEVQEIIVVPILLFAAGHAKRDIPQAIEQAKHRYPQLRFACTQPLDCHPDLLALSELRLRDALTAEQAKIAEVTFLLVGRGSLDETATAAMHRYASLFATRLAIREYRVAFMAMAKPEVVTVLNELAMCSGGPVVVQPHLLFQGDLLDQLRSEVNKVAVRSPNRFFMAGHLGPATLLAEAITGLIRVACGSTNH